jgi:transitional endoplasmic reticulum ATPase
MEKYEESLGLAQIYFNQAKDREPRSAMDASVLYLKAKREYIMAEANCQDETMKCGLKQMADDCQRRVDLLKPPEKTRERVPIGDGKRKRHEDSSLKDEYSISIPTTSYADVSGMEDLKHDLEKAIIWPLQNPEDYAPLQRKARGILMYGPPGCGKTYIAKAAAGEANKRLGQKVSFIEIRASDVKSSWVGESEKNIRRVFEYAAEKAPAILFFDEIDGLGMDRDDHKSSYNKSFTCEFLPSFGTIESKNVVVIGATNKPWNVEVALTRPGRLDKSIFVPPPDFAAREEMFKLRTKSFERANDIDYKALAGFTENYTSSDIEQICLSAYVDYLLEDRRKNNSKRPLSQLDLLMAIKSTKPSLNRWVDRARRKMKRGDEMYEQFPDMYMLIEKIKPSDQPNGGTDDVPDES